VGTIHSFFQWSTDIRSFTITDPFFLAAGKHFDNLFKRYGTPLIILNLIKVRQSYFKSRPPLICSLPVAWASRSEAPSQCVDYPNQFLPEGNEILLRAWYMSQAYEESVPPDGYRKTQDVIRYLKDIAEEAIQLTEFFHSCPGPYSCMLKKGSVSRPFRPMDSSC